jgi:hypothetical protein
MVPKYDQRLDLIFRNLTMKYLGRFSMPTHKMFFV